MEEGYRCQSVAPTWSLPLQMVPIAMQIVVCCAGGALSSSPRLTSASLTPSVFGPRQKRTTHSASGDGTSCCMPRRKLE